MLDKRRRRQDKLRRWQPVLGDRRAPGTWFLGPKRHAFIAHAGVDRSVTLHGLRRTFAVLLQEVARLDHPAGWGMANVESPSSTTYLAATRR